MTRMNLTIWYLNLMLFDGPILAREILSTGIKLGFSHSTLVRAKKAIGVKAYPERGFAGKKIIRWWWTTGKKLERITNESFSSL